MKRALFLALALVPTLALAAPASLPAKLKVGDIAPPIRRADLSGKNFDLAALRGRPVLIDFWASWCAPCIAEIPHLAALQKRYDGRLQIVGVSMDDFMATTRQTMRTIAFNYPVVPGDARLGLLYGGVLGLPLEMLVGADGRIRAIWRGEIKADTLDQAVAAVLAEKKMPPG